MAGLINDMTPEEFAEAFAKFSSGAYCAEALDVMARSHRTHQQRIMKFFVQFVKMMADQETDLRNESAVNYAKDLVRLAKEGVLKDGMPLI